MPNKTGITVIIGLAIQRHPACHAFAAAKHQGTTTLLAGPRKHGTQPIALAGPKR